MADETSGIGDLRDVACPVGPVGAAAVPDLVVEHDDAFGPSEIVLNSVFPFAAFHFIWWRRAEQVGTRDDFGAAVVPLGDIGQVVVAGEQENGQADVCGRIALRDEEVRRIVLVPSNDTTARIGPEGVVVDDVTVLCDERFCERDDRFQVEEAQVSRACFEHAGDKVVTHFLFDFWLIVDGPVEVLP